MGEKMKLHKLIGDMRVAMLTTTDERGKLRSRPLATVDVEDDRELLFFVRQGSGKVDEIRDDNQVNVAYADVGSNTYVSISGRAHVKRDPALAKEHWAPTMKAWFKGPDDPELAVLTVRVERGEYWDGPSGMVATLLELGKAALGERGGALMGEQGTIRPSGDVQPRRS